jgi:tripartite-type tricarboxylate transporter receptor subunit TctC
MKELLFSQSMRSINWRVANKTISTIAAVFTIAILLRGEQAFAAEPSAFYRDKKLTFLVGGDPGGTYDIYARLLSRHITRYVPGNPSVVFQYITGAGSVIAMNYLYNSGPQDGTVIIAPNRTAPFVPFLGQQKTQYDPTKIKWIGSLNNDVGVMQTWGTVPIKTIDEARKAEVIVGATSPLTDGYQYPTLMNRTLGTRFKLVTGYKSSTEIMKAFEAGEVRGIEVSFLGMQDRFPDWRNQINLLTQLSLRKHPTLSSVPSIFEVIRPEILSPGFTQDEVEAMWRIILTQQVVGRPYGVGPNVPDERVALLRTAFASTLTDRAFVQDAERSRLELQPLQGDEVQKMIGLVASAPRDRLEKLRELIR